MTDSRFPRRRGFVLLAYAILGPAGWRLIVDVHHGLPKERLIRPDGGVESYMTLVGPEPGLHVANWIVLEVGIDRILDWEDIGLVDGVRMWRSKGWGSERFEALVAETAYLREDWVSSEPYWVEHHATLYPNGPLSDAV